MGKREPPHQGCVRGLECCRLGAATGWSADAHAVVAQGLGDRLEEGRTAGGAVATAAGGQAVGHGARVERTAAVAALGADGGLDQTGDGLTAAVVDGGVERGDPATVGAGGGAAAVDR